MIKKLCILTVLIIPVQGIAQNKENVQLEDSLKLQNTVLYIAQNTEENKEASPQELPPLPPPKISVSTEKPIENGLKIGEEIKPEESVQKDEAIPSENAVIPIQEKEVKIPSDTEREAPAVKRSLKIMEELCIYNVPTANLRTVKLVNDEEFNLRSMVYGEELGYIHVLTADSDGNFRETWKSPSLNAPIRGVFIDDLENDGEAEIIAYTSDGNFYIYGFDSHDLKYRTPDGTYQNINCMQIANMDNSPEKELFFIAVKPGEEQSDGGQPRGYLIQFDPLSQFEEWTSQERYSATDMKIGNVDNDPEYEIILNTGEILDSQFKDLEWQSTIPFGSRLYLIDMDDDGILELLLEYDQSYVRIIDVDQRQEKW